MNDTERSPATIEPQVQPAIELELQSSSELEVKPEMEPTIEPEMPPAMEAPIDLTTGRKLQSSFEVEVEPDVEPTIQPEREATIELEMKREIEPQLQPTPAINPVNETDNTEKQEDLVLNDGRHHFNLRAKTAHMLYPHQRAGIDWLWSLHTKGMGGILGDDMGLGKTMQVCLIK